MRWRGTGTEPEHVPRAVGGCAGLVWKWGPFWGEETPEPNVPLRNGCQAEGLRPSGTMEEIRQRCTEVSSISTNASHAGLGSNSGVSIPRVQR